MEIIIAILGFAAFLLSFGITSLVMARGSTILSAIGGTSVGCSVLSCIAVIIIGLITYSSGTSNVDATAGATIG